MTREFFTPERKRWIAPSIHFASDSMLRLNSLNCTRQQSCLVGLGRWRIESLSPQFDDLTLVGRSAWCPVPLDRPSNREECSLAFETLHNTGNEQRGVLGSALLEEEYVLRCLSARAITEAAQDQARHAEGIPYELETFTQLGVVTDLSEVLDPRGKGWQPKIEGKPVVYRQEFPGDNAVASFRVGESPHRRR